MTSPKRISTSKVRREPKGSQSRLGRTSRKLSSKPWNKLTPMEKSLRVRALEVLRIMKQGISFTLATKYAGTDPRTARRQLNEFIYKRKRRWHAKARDDIERGMVIYEKGKIRSIVIRGTVNASCIGSYLNHAKLVLSGKVSYDLFKRWYKDMIITDVDGKEHRLETRLDTLKDIELSREDIQFSDIYDY